MNGPKTIAALAAAAIIAIGFAGRETIRVHRSSLALAAANREIASAENGADLMRKASAAAAALPFYPKMLAGNNPLAPPAHPGPPHLSAHQLIQNPVVRDAVSRLVAWNNAHYWGPMLRERGLTAEQVERAEYLIAQTESFGDFGPERLRLKTDPRPNSQIHSELTALIGEDDRNFQLEYTLRRTITDPLAGYLADNKALSADQGKQLTTLMLAEFEQLGGRKWSRVKSQLAGVLLPDQIGALTDIFIARFGVFP